MPIFPAGALLQVHIPGEIENEDMNSAMPQVIPMHFGAARVGGDSVILVDYWELLGGGRAHLLVRRRRDAIRKGDPLQQ
jgi:hypothetical protein